MLLHCSTSLIYDIKRVIQDKAPSAEEDAKTTKQLRYCVLILGVLAVLGAIAKLSLLAAGFTYIYGAFGSTFFWVTWLGLFLSLIHISACLFLRRTKYNCTCRSPRRRCAPESSGC